jgi:hypothetical protein
MPGLRPSQSMDAEAAARQAEFNEKKWVWVPDEVNGYLAGWVVREDETEGDVVLAANNEVRSRAPPTLAIVECLADQESTLVRPQQDEPAQVRPRRRYRRPYAPE